MEGVSNLETTINLYDGMRAFTRVVEARDMGVARSVVHKHVLKLKLKLEEKLGTQLLRRSAHQCPDVLRHPATGTTH